MNWTVKAMPQQHRDESQCLIVQVIPQQASPLSNPDRLQSQVLDLCMDYARAHGMRVVGNVVVDHRGEMVYPVPAGNWADLLIARPAVVLGLIGSDQLPSEVRDLLLLWLSRGIRVHAVPFGEVTPVMVERWFTTGGRYPVGSESSAARPAASIDLGSNDSHEGLAERELQARSRRRESERRSRQEALGSRLLRRPTAAPSAGPSPGIGAPDSGHAVWGTAGDAEDMLDMNMEQAAGSAFAIAGSAFAIGSGGRRGGVPVRPQSEHPLPHDGLFVRRNNSYGTKSTVGIDDLIEQGVLVDQDRVRIDDFVASDAASVPAPGPGEAIEVSFGFAPILDGCTTHEATTHLLEIALRAAQSAPDGPTQQSSAPVPVNFVFVVDVSGSMRGEKLEMAKAAIATLYARLRYNDVLGLITFDTQARTILTAHRKSELGEDDFSRALASMHADGGTDINLGIEFGIDEIGRFDTGAGDTVNCVYVFSDGDPTSGERNWVTIRRNIAERVRTGVSLSCFGFGADARMRELDALAGLTGGHSTFVARPEDVQETLLEDLGRRDRLASFNIQMQFSIDDDVEVWHLYGHDLISDPAGRAAVQRDAQAARRTAREAVGVESLPDIIDEEKGIRIFAPDLAVGETYWVVFELRIPADRGPSGVGAVRVQYVDALARTTRRHEQGLTESDANIPARTVLAHGLGLRTSEVTFFALDDLHAGDRDLAERRISDHVNVFKNAYTIVPLQQFRDDQVVLRKFMSLAGNLGTMVSWTDTGGVRGYTQFAMNEFGQVRSGYLRVGMG
jgi:uncharacterized protein YegL